MSEWQDELTAFKSAVLLAKGGVLDGGLGLW